MRLFTTMASLTGTGTSQCRDGGVAAIHSLRLMTMAVVLMSCQLLSDTTENTAVERTYGGTGYVDVELAFASGVVLAHGNKLALQVWIQ